MVSELIRTERVSLKSLDEVLDAIRKTDDTDELATLLLMVTEFYSDAGCRCEEIEVTLGEDSDEAKVCNTDVRKSRDEVIQTYRDLVSRIKGK